MKDTYITKQQLGSIVKSFILQVFGHQRHIKKEILDMRAVWNAGLRDVL